MKNAIKLFALFSLAFSLSCAVFALPSAVTAGDTASEEVYDVITNVDEDGAYLLVGEGTESSPYLISSAAEFNKYSSLINQSGSSYADKHYKLSSNIDFSDSALIPFGVSESIPFKGTLDGDGYALLNVKPYDIQCSGVVGYMTQGTVKNLKVSFADMTNYKDYTNLKYFGGILGYGLVSTEKRISISGCTTEGNFMLHTAGAAYCGGIIGYFRCEEGDGAVTDCITSISFDVKSEKSHYVAGFVAYLFSGSDMECSFKNCISYGNVKAVTPYIQSNAGGFAAYVNCDAGGWSGWAGEETAVLASDTYTFDKCISYGSVYGQSKSKAYAGGFIGYDEGEGSINLNSCYKNASAEVSAVSNKTTAINNMAEGTAKENLDNEEFYKSVVGFDFSNGVYMSEGKIQIRETAKSNGSASILDQKDVRLSNKPGLRFRSVLDASKRDYCFEYGFIIARKDVLDGAELTFDFEGSKICGVAFDSTTDKYVDKDDDTVTISGVVINIPEEHYGTELVARTYIKYVNDGETIILYSEPETSSLNLSAVSVKNSEGFEYLTDEQKEMLEAMLPEA